jgi:HEAT repeat protein
MHSSTSPSNGEGDRSASGAPEHVDTLIDQVLDSGSETAAVQLLSDLTRAGAARLRERWPTIPEAERLFLVQLLAQDADVNLDNNYDRVMLVALDDPLPETRLAAVEGLTELESPAFLDLLINRVEAEEDIRVRAAQASALGRFALKVELGELDDADSERVRTLLLRLLASDPALDVRRRALESIGYIADDDSIAELIQQAFDSGDHAMRVSAIHAMGCQSSADWLDIIHEEMESEEPEIRYEAVIAAGMIGSERSVLDIIDLLRDEDAEVRMAAIAALGAIGGRTAINTLRKLAQDDAPAVAEAAEAALEEAQLTSSPFRPIL